MDLEQEKIRQKFADPAGHQLVAQLSLLFEFLHWSSIFHNFPGAYDGGDCLKH